MNAAVVPAGRRGIYQRLGWLAVLLAVEWVPISALVHTARSGASLARFLIAFVGFFLILAFTRVRSVLPQISGELELWPIGTGWLTAHAAALLVFLALSFSGPSQGLPSMLSAVLWFASGIGALVFATLALVPLGVAWRLIRVAGSAWIYALAGGAAAWRLVPFGWSLWNSSRGQVLTGITFDFVHWLLRHLLPGVIADRARLMIGTPRFTVEIGGACAGFEGLGMILVFGLLWLWFFRREFRFPQACLLVPAGLALMWVLNAVRIVVLIAIGHFGAPGVAVGGFHSQAGWISFTGVTLAYAGALQHFRWFTVEDRPAKGAGNPASVFLIPFLAILATSLLTHALSVDFEWLYPLRFVAAACALWYFRDRLVAIDWSLSWAGPVVGVAGFAVWIALERMLHPAAAAPMPPALAAASVPLRTFWIAIRALAAITTVPVAEELAFRGFLLRRIISTDFEAVPFRHFTGTALLVSSIAFGALHGSRWIAGSLAGLLYAYAAGRRGELGDALVAHATTNAILAAFVMVGGQWQLW